MVTTIEGEAQSSAAAPAHPERVVSLFVTGTKLSGRGRLMLLTSELPPRPMMDATRRWVEIVDTGVDRPALDVAAARAIELCAAHYVLRLPIFRHDGEVFAHSASFLAALEALEHHVASPPLMPAPPEPLPGRQPAPQLALALPTPARPTF